ncbi:cold-shock protein [Kocuria sp. M1R5S2]|uniref:cold-shock protein n=1 Tax=Kocuria rhizosphaerae TaxID=3376285 RepID=UPI0037AC2A17
MAAGVVKWFDADKGFGFISPDDGSSDVFVSLAALGEGPSAALAVADRVEFEMDIQPFGPEVSRLRVVV